MYATSDRDKMGNFDISTNIKPQPNSDERTEQLQTLLSPTKLQIESLPQFSNFIQNDLKTDALKQLDLGLFWQWMVCFAVVNFDLDTGQSVEFVYPPINLLPSEKSNM